MTAVKQRMGNRDGFSIFGEYVGNKLHRLKDPHLQSFVQNHVTSMLFMMEMGNINHLVSSQRNLFSSAPSPSEIDASDSNLAAS
jgi:hypothetical protein